MTILTALILTTSGCSTLGGLAADQLLGGSDKGIEVDANAGQAKTEGDSSVAQNGNTNVSGQVDKSQTFDSPVETVINESGLAWWELAVIVLLAGWAIPSPGEMLAGLVRAIRDVSNAIRGR